METKAVGMLSNPDREIIYGCAYRLVPIALCLPSKARSIRYLFGDLVPLEPIAARHVSCVTRSGSSAPESITGHNMRQFSNDFTSRRKRLIPFALFAFLSLAIHLPFASASKEADTRCIIIELYLSDKDTQSKSALAAARELAKSQKGIRLAIRNVDESDRNRERLTKIAKYFKFDPDQTPVIYCCNQVIRNADNAKQFRTKMEAAITIEVFTRKGCTRCDDAKKFLDKLSEKYAGFRVKYMDILAETSARNELNRLVRKHRKAAVSTPVLHLCDSLIIGFDSEATTGKRIEQKLERWTIDCPPSKKKPSNEKASDKPPRSEQTLFMAPEVATSIPFS